MSYSWHVHDSKDNNCALYHIEIYLVVHYLSINKICLN